MVEIYVLYLDVYFLENVLLNLVLLIFTLILTGRRIRFIRLLSASLIGGNDGDSANHITASLRYRIYFADFADRIACGYNCIGNQEYV